MRDRANISAILRLQADHGQILQTIEDYAKAAEEMLDPTTSDTIGVPDIDRLRKFEEYTTAIHKDITEHMLFEEREVLPIITMYAEEIIRRGLLYEHKEIDHSIIELREKLAHLISAPSDYEARVTENAAIIAKLLDIRMMIEEHAHKQEAILELAHLACGSDDTG